MIKIMKYEGIFSWISLILLIEYASTEDTCERDTCLGLLSFGSFLPRSVFTTKYQVSPYQCATECKRRRQRCKSFNYRRSALSCQLCEEDSGPEGINLHPKAGSIHSNIDTWRNIPIGNCNEINCSWTESCDSSKDNTQKACMKTECQFAVLKPGVTIVPSNETSVRTKARYGCIKDDMERGDFLTTCLESTAEWSPTDFKCVCKTPPEKSWTRNVTAEVEVGQNYTYRCEDGRFVKGDQNPTITCLHDGSWTSTRFICVKQNWTQDTIYINNMHKSEIISTTTETDLLACMEKCDYNQTCLSFFYYNNTSQCVLSSSFRRGLPYGSDFAAGLVYYIAPSVSCDMEYKNVPIGDSYWCIKLYNIALRFKEAMTKCESEKAKLLVVTTRAQIADLTKFFGQIKCAFLGMSDESNENSWVSWQGYDVSPNWYSGEPNDVNEEDCVCVSDQRNGLSDISCYTQNPFLCHKNHL